MKKPITMIVDDYLCDVLESALAADCDHIGYVADEQEWERIEELAEQIIQHVRIVRAYHASKKGRRK
jgi:hypothetical protein